MGRSTSALVLLDRDHRSPTRPRRSLGKRLAFSVAQLCKKILPIRDRDDFARMQGFPTLARGFVRMTGGFGSEIAAMAEISCRDVDLLCRGGEPMATPL